MFFCPMNVQFIQPVLYLYPDFFFQYSDTIKNVVEMSLHVFPCVCVSLRFVLRSGIAESKNVQAFKILENVI